MTVCEMATGQREGQEGTRTSRFGLEGWETLREAAAGWDGGHRLTLIPGRCLEPTQEGFWGSIWTSHTSLPDCCVCPRFRDRTGRPTGPRHNNPQPRARNGPFFFYSLLSWKRCHIWVPPCLLSCVFFFLYDNSLIYTAMKTLHHF